MDTFSLPDIVGELVIHRKTVKNDVKDLFFNSKSDLFNSESVPAVKYPSCCASREKDWYA